MPSVAAWRRSRAKCMCGASSPLPPSHPMPVHTAERGSGAFARELLGDASSNPSSPKCFGSSEPSLRERARPAQNGGGGVGAEDSPCACAIAFLPCALLDCRDGWWWGTIFSRRSLAASDAWAIGSITVCAAGEWVIGSITVCAACKAASPACPSDLAAECPARSTSEAAAERLPLIEHAASRREIDVRCVAEEERRWSAVGVRRPAVAPLAGDCTVPGLSSDMARSTTPESEVRRQQSTRAPQGREKRRPISRSAPRLGILASHSSEEFL